MLQYTGNDWPEAQSAVPREEVEGNQTTVGLVPYKASESTEKRSRADPQMNNGHLLVLGSQRV
jgi:hypothetical protein